MFTPGKKWCGFLVKELHRVEEGGGFGAGGLADEAVEGDFGSAKATEARIRPVALTIRIGW